MKLVRIESFVLQIYLEPIEQFSTDYASGSTSQVANIMEAINFGCKFLLIDEDRSATNFMIQDIKMRSLIKHEPITPFTERVRELYEAIGVSSVLVIGGSGEFLSVADQIILMDNFVSKNVTQEAINLCEHDKPRERIPLTKWEIERKITADHFSSYPQGSGTEKLMVSTMGYMMIGDEQIDIRGLELPRINEVLSVVNRMKRLNFIQFEPSEHL